MVQWPSARSAYLPLAASETDRGAGDPAGVARAPVDLGPAAVEVGPDQVAVEGDRWGLPAAPRERPGDGGASDLLAGGHVGDDDVPPLAVRLGVRHVGAVRLEAGDPVTHLQVEAAARPVGSHQRVVRRPGESVAASVAAAHHRAGGGVVDGLDRLAQVDHPAADVQLAADREGSGAREVTRSAGGVDRPVRVPEELDPEGGTPAEDGHDGERGEAGERLATPTEAAALGEDGGGRRRRDVEAVDLVVQQGGEAVSHGGLPGCGERRRRRAGCAAGRGRRRSGS